MEVEMFGVGTGELLVMAVIAVFTFGIPIAVLVLVYRIYQNTRK
jgi:hypothetical protein